MQAKQFILILTCTAGILFASCGHSNNDFLKLVAERDSLKTETKLNSAKLQDYTETVQLMNATLDSIAHQEVILFETEGDQRPTRDDVKQNLLRFESIILNQHNRIEELESRLRSKQDSNSQTLQMIEHIKIQVQQKNAQIVQLKDLVEKKNISIAKLQEIVESQNLKIKKQEVTIHELNTRTKKQGEALAAQDAILNNGYVLVGSKADLKRKGITRRGKLISNNLLDRSKFFKVDIRNWREISFKAKRPKILTNMPSSSYELTTSGNKDFVLHVKNPSEFWRISNYLVIQTD